VRCALGVGATQISGRTKSNDGPKPVEASNVTIREQEILRWIYLGKSNFEIGAILKNQSADREEPRAENFCANERGQPRASGRQGLDCAS